MKILIYVLMGVVVLFQVIASVSFRKKRDSFVNKISECIMNQHFNQFYALIESAEAKKYLPVFNREFLKLNVFILEEKDKAVDVQLKNFKKIKLNDAQKQEVYLKAFLYYTEKERAAESLKYKKKLFQIGVSEELKKTIERMYKIYIEKNDIVLEELLSEKEQNKNQYINKMLISKIKDNSTQK